MKAENLIDIIGEASDQYIEDAKSFKKPAEYSHAKRWLAVACICSLIFGIYFSENQYYDEAFGCPSDTEEKYRIVAFDADMAAEPVHLFAASVATPEDIREVVSRRHPDVNCAYAVYGFSFSDETDNYWFPVVENGRIVDIVFATYGSKGDVLTGHSKSHTDELNSIAKYTSESSPLYVVTGENFNYYVIGDTAYIEDRFSEAVNDYIGEFVLPDKDIIVVEIN